MQYPRSPVQIRARLTVVACACACADGEACPALDDDLVVLLVEKCPDLGPLSRVP